MSSTGDVCFLLRADGSVHLGDVRQVSSANGSVFTASRDNTAMILAEQPPTDAIIPGPVMTGHTAFVNFALFHPSMALIGGKPCVVTGSNDKHVAVWNPATAMLEAVLDGHAHGICCGVVMSLQKPGDIVTGDWGGVCLVFDSATGSVKQTYTGHRTAVRAIAQLPGTTSVVTASGDKTIHQWDVLTGTTMAVFTGHADVVQCICAMSGTRFASGSNDATIIIWDTAIGTNPLRLLTAHDSLVYAICYCPQRELLFSVSEDRTLKIWRSEAATISAPTSEVGAVVVQSISHPCVVWSVCLTSTGDIVTGGSDGVVRMWTTDMTKKASEEKLRALKAAVANQTIDVKVANVAGLDIESMAQADELHLRKGTQQGERLFVRTEAGTIEVYVWNQDCWEKIGTVVEGPDGDAYSGAGQGKAKKYLNGVPHDYVFDVDVNGTMLKLTYDRGQSVFDAAQNFINQNSTIVSQIHKEEIQNFILTNVDPQDIQQGSTTSANLSNAPAPAEPVFSEYAREAAARRQAGVSHIPSWGEALRGMESTGVSANDVAFSGYAREAMLRQQEGARQAAAAAEANQPPGKNAQQQSISRWDTCKNFTSFNAVGATKRIVELTDDAGCGAVVQRVVSATEGEPKQEILDDIMTLYHRLPEASRFPALDLLSHLLAVAAHPFAWLQQLLLSAGGGGHASSQAFLQERIQNLRNVSDVEALVTTRLFAHFIAALEKSSTVDVGESEVLSAESMALVLAMLTKAPQSLLQTKNNNVKAANSALLQNAAVLLSRCPALLGEDGVQDATRGVMRVLAQWLLFEPISSPYTRELMATLMTLMVSDGSSGSSKTAAVAVEVGRSTLAHTLRALETGPEPHYREAAVILLHLLNNVESH